MKFISVKLNRQLLYAGCAILISACGNVPSTAEDEAIGVRPKDLIENIVAEPDSITYDLVYEGTLPCKDCGGIKTTLRLSTEADKFELKEEFLKTEIKPVITKGHFMKEMGYGDLKSAVFYTLNSDLDKTEQLYFLGEYGTNGPLLKLDNEKHKTNHTNFTLTKISK